MLADPPPSLCIVADDLTGALDAAAPFARRSMRSIILFDQTKLGEALATAPHLVTVSTRSREMEPDAAFEAVRSFVAGVPSATRLFKKIDSRMKGNIEVELQALPVAPLLVAPAIPEFARLTRQGAVEGFGIEKPIDIGERLGSFAPAASVPDIETDNDLIRALEAHPDNTLVGARGLADALARLMTGRASADDIAAPKARKALFIIGSHDPITVAQADLLRARAGVTWVAAANGVAPAFSLDAPVTVLQATPGEQTVSGIEVADNLARSLPADLRAWIDLLFLTGGATAEAILAHLGIGMASVVGEALPGLPVTRVDGLTIITKSGGFGDRQTLVDLAAAIAAEGGGNWGCD